MTRSKEVILALRDAATWLTTEQVARMINLPIYSTSALLSKLGTYGRIQKRRDPDLRGMVWRANE